MIPSPTAINNGKSSALHPRPKMSLVVVWNRFAPGGGFAGGIPSFSLKCSGFCGRNLVYDKFVGI
jgi:hypothetical protein